MSNKILQNNMTNFDVKKLMYCNSDWERNQYTLLSRVKEWQTNFRKNKVYPYLNESIELHHTLGEILQENLESKWWLEKEVGQKVVADRYVVYEKAQHISQQLNNLLSFVEWALKLNRPVMEEGFILREFIEDNLVLEPLNEEPNFRGKGYLALNDNHKEVLNIYLYDLKYEWFDEEASHSLNIKPIRSIPNAIVKGDVNEVMDDFLKYSQPLHKPMAYICRNDIEFPYKESIYPIVEEQLLITLMS
ncbi:hypothetical protein ACFLSS_01240 [Bacteroidota bacterium]